jgi:DNA-binding CsgD family transcriptional regulator
MLVGRRAERDRIDRLLDEAAAGRGGALVIRGEAGIGKTALVQYARDRAARTATVVQATGVESELELPFAGLADVLRPLLSCVDELEDSQQELVRGLVGIGPPRAADRFAQATASLALLAAAARSTMLLVLVDDAHWLDSSSRDVLLFAARRLDADAVAMLFAARDGEEIPFEASGVEAILLSGLVLDEAVELLDGIVGADGVETLIGLTQGNPLGLLELPVTLSEAQLHGRAPLGEPPRVGAGIQRAFLRRVLVLGEEARRALLVAAADDSGAIGVVETACGLLGVDAVALRRAEEAGLVIVDGGGIAFRHPLVRATVYHSAAPSERREAHSALARAVDGRDELRWAWHAAAAAAGPDAKAASALAAVAAKTRSRGAYGSASAAFDRAARLTPDRDEAAAFFAGAAEAAWQGGRTAQANALVAEGLSLGPNGSTRAELLACRGQMALLGEDQESAYDNLLEAARLFEETEPSRAADLLAEAIGPSIQISGTAVSEAASRLSKLRPAGDPLRELLIAQGLLSAISVAGDVGGRERVELALTAAKEAGVLDGSPFQLFWVARGMFMVGQNDEAARLARRAVDRARDNGAVALAPQALRLLASADFDRGRWRTAYAAAGEGAELGREVEQLATVCACLGVLADIDAAAGNAAPCRAYAAAAIEIGRERNLGFYRERAERALGRLDLATGRIPEAIERLERSYARLARAGNWELNVSPAWDLVEAHARAGDVESARGCLAEAVEAMPAATENEEAIIQRCRGIVSGESSFEPAFAGALAAHDAEPFPFERARTLLVYGERLRREGRRKSARERLRAALELFDDLGADAWSARARSELAGTGERLRPAHVARESLTPREMQVALAVAEGRSNGEVAAALYLTPKTVEYHLTRVYRKLGLRSRGELAREFARSGNLE